MEALFSANADIVMSTLLAIVLFFARKRLDPSDTFNWLFLRSGLIVLCMMILEGVSMFLNGITHRGAVVVHTLIRIGLTGIPPFLTYFWYLVVRALTGEPGARKIKRNPVHMLPAFAVMLAALFSPMYRLLFYIDSEGVYHRGQLFLMMIVATYAYLVLALAILIKRRKHMSVSDPVFLALFCILPIIGGTLQWFIYGFSAMWSFSAIALVIMYMFLQDQMAHTDSLTGAWTRSTFEHHMTQLLRGNSGRNIGLVFADIDDFKSINDHFGHQEGDYAIRAFTDTLKQFLRKGDFIARIGGDEFVILINVDTRDALWAIIERIQNALEAFNRSSGKEYKLSCSFGADIYPLSASTNVDALLRQVDHLMYMNKRWKKWNRTAEANRDKPDHLDRPA